MKHLFLILFSIKQLISISYAANILQLTPIQDNSIYSDSTANSNGIGELFCGQTCTGANSRALIQFDLTGLSCSATVTSVTVTFDVDFTSPTSTANNYTLRPLLTEWGEGNSFGSGTGAPALFPDATWIDAKTGTNSWTTPGGDFGSVSATKTFTAGTGLQTFTSTASLVSVVQGWINNPSSNKGWILIGDESLNCSSRRIGSRDFGNAPVIEITYTIPNANFTYNAASYCINSSDPTPNISGVPGGTFSSSPSGLSINSNTGKIHLSTSTPGPYLVTYNTPGSCSNSSYKSVTINAMSNASFNYNASFYCVNAIDPTPTITGLLGGTFSSSPSGLNFNSSTGIIHVSLSNPATYTITYAVTGTCPNSSTNSVAIKALSNANFSYSSPAYCAGAANPTPAITGLSGGTFSWAPSGLVLNSGTGTIDLIASSPTTYTVTYSVTGNCPNSSAHAVTVNALSNANFTYNATDYCASAADPAPAISGMAGGVFSSSPAGLVINAATGIIDVSASNPATYTVTYSVTGTCPNSSTRSVTINALSNANFTYSAAAYCVNGADPSPTITGLQGGVFSSTPSGLVIDANTGAIDVSASNPATYIVTYSVTGTCPNSSTRSVTINSLSNPNFTYSASAYCLNAQDPTPTITGLTGGIFYITTLGLVINSSTGTIDVSASIPASYIVTYAVTGNCPNSSTQSIIINPLSNANFTYSSATYCLTAPDPSPTISGIAGGIFTSTPVGLIINSVTGVIDVSASNPGTYSVTYTVSGTCPNSYSNSVNIVTVGNANFNYSSPSYCTNNIDPTPTISGISGGIFSATPFGLNINAATGTLNVGASNPGSYTVSYVVSGICPSSSSQTVSINPASNANFNYGSSSYCTNDNDPSPIITGLSGGTFSSSPSGLIINAATGIIDLGASNPALYSVTYTSPGICPNTLSQSIIITGAGNASFNYSSASYCRNEANPTPVIVGQTGGDFSSLPAGLNINSSTGALNLSVSTLGTYTVTYTTPGPCTNSSSQSVTVIATGNADFYYNDTTYCSNNPNPVPTITGQSGGTFVSNPPGLIVDSATGVINISASNPGTYTVVYTKSGVCSSVSSRPVSINTLSNADFSYPSTFYCNNSSDATPLISGQAGGHFSLSPTGINVHSVTGIIYFNNSVPGNYYITYTTTGACPDSTTKPITILGIDTSITINFQSLTANATGSSYQWLDCNTMLPISGDTNKTFTPSSNGNYAVILNQYGCADTSNCHNFIFINVRENAFVKSINVFPNPTKDKVDVKLNRIFDNINVHISTLQGKIIDTFRIESASEFQFNFNASTGIYFLDIITNTGEEFVYKIVKE